MVITFAIVFVCHCVFVCIYIGNYPPLRFWSVSSCVTICHLGFSLASSVSVCVWECVCLGLYAIFVFPMF
jgi:hypothetical protein